MAQNSSESNFFGSEVDIGQSDVIESEATLPLVIDHIDGAGFGGLFLCQNSSWFTQLAKELDVPIPTADTNSGFCWLASLGMMLSREITNPIELTSILKSLAINAHVENIMTNMGTFYITQENVLWMIGHVNKEMELRGSSMRMRQIDIECENDEGSNRIA